MSNKILRNKQIIRNNEVAETETNFSREADKSSGIEDTPTRLVSGGQSYPRVSGPLVSVPPDHKFSPDRDRVDPDWNCSNTFGMALGGQSTPRQTEGGVVPSPASPSTSPRRRPL